MMLAAQLLGRQIRKTEIPSVSPECSPERLSRGGDERRDAHRVERPIRIQCSRDYGERQSESELMFVRKESYQSIA